MRGHNYEIWGGGMSGSVCSTMLWGNQTWVFWAAWQWRSVFVTRTDSWQLLGLLSPYLSGHDCNFLSPFWALNIGISVVWRRERRQPVGHDYSFLLLCHTHPMNPPVHFRRSVHTFSYCKETEIFDGADDTRGFVSFEK